MNGKTTFLNKAQTAWGERLPPEVRVLAEHADSGTAAATARRIGMSPATVSHLISAKAEKHDLAAIYERIRGALMGDTVACPMKGDMSRKVCLDWQGKSFASTSADRVRMFHACRSGCPHSRLKGA